MITNHLIRSRRILKTSEDNAAFTLVVCPVYLSKRIYQQDNPCQTKVGVVEEGSGSDIFFFSVHLGVGQIK